MSAIVWFSGISALNLVDSVPYGVWEEYGCNHFDEYRSVDHLVSYDRQMVHNRQLKPNITYWTQPKWRSAGWRSHRWNKDKVHISDSGTLAVETALQHHDQVYVIGADWGVTDVSLQDHHYAFRGWSPPKFIKQHEWLLDRGDKVTWVHLERQPWMVSYLNHSDFLDLATSTRH